MLARLEAHVAEQRRFAANASHQLRTPPAITRTLLDVARNDPNRDNGKLVDRLPITGSLGWTRTSFGASLDWQAVERP
jgi:two-component system, OmpR family, sensor histidine kinase VanS